MQRARLVPPAVVFCSGILAELRFGPFWSALGVAAVCGVASAHRYRRLACIVAAVFAIGIADAAVFARGSNAIDDAHTRRFSATVIEQLPEFRSSNDSSFLLHLDDGRNVAVALREALTTGERIEVRGRVFAFDGPRNPGEASMRDIEAERGIDGRLGHARVLARYGVDEGDASLWLPRLRAWASRRVRALLPEPDASILAGAIWGERGALPHELREEFQETGTVHLLVTAGLHLGVVAWVTLTALRALGAGRISASLTTIAIAWLYAEFSGAHLPSLRAATMLTFALLARATGRESYLPNALAAAAVVIAALRPESLLSLSFALSFSCVGAIVLFAEPIAERIARFGVPRFLCEALALSLATQLGTWPLTASAFLIIAPYAPIANALVVPVAGVAMLAGGLMLASSPLGFAAAGLANVDTVLLDWIARVVSAISRLPGAVIVAAPPPWWTICCYDIALLVSAYSARGGATRRGALLVAAASALCLWPPRIEPHVLRVTAIDVGQADALLVQTPEGHAFLIDAGGRLERGADAGTDSEAETIGERIVVPFLIRSGVRRLDAVLLSHPHGDHAGGIAPVLRQLGAAVFADSGQRYSGHAYRDALAAASERNIPLVEPRGGTVWTTGDGVTFRFYGPTLPLITGTRSDINANSLVFRLEYGRTRMLFMGDAGSETEARLLASGDDLRADVLKVGHHGSAYGTTADFLRAVRPRIALISVGSHNLFGHPAPSTIAALSGAGTRIYRTDRDGAIRVSSDGDTCVAEAFLAR